MTTETTIQTLAQQIGLTINASRVDENPNMGADAKRDRQRNGENIFPKRKLSTFYSMGSAHRNAPKAIDVLDCLLSDASYADESFEDYCANLGYETDSRTARKSWKATIKNAAKLRVFLGADFDAFLQAERL